MNEKNVHIAANRPEVQHVRDLWPKQDLIGQYCLQEVLHRSLIAVEMTIVMVEADRCILWIACTVDKTWTDRPDLFGEQCQRQMTLNVSRTRCLFYLLDSISGEI